MSHSQTPSLLAPTLWKELPESPDQRRRRLTPAVARRLELKAPDPRIDHATAASSIEREFSRY